MCAELPPSTVPCSQTSIDGSVVKDTEADLTKSAEITGFHSFKQIDAWHVYCWTVGISFGVWGEWEREKRRKRMGRKGQDKEERRGREEKEKKGNRKTKEKEKKKNKEKKRIKKKEKEKEKELGPECFFFKSCIYIQNKIFQVTDLDTLNFVTGNAMLYSMNVRVFCK